MNNTRKNWRTQVNTKIEWFVGHKKGTGVVRKVLNSSDRNWHEFDVEVVCSDGEIRTFNVSNIRALFKNK